MQPPQASTTRTRVRVLVVLMLVAMRLPSLVQPAGGDQSLYTYVGQRVIDGGVPYRDAWDQKPPAVFFVYAFLWRLWPNESVVPAADLAAAALVAWLLVILGRRLFSAGAGYAAAALFLLLGDPWLQRLSGLNVRAQCETFIALAVTTSLVLATSPSRRGRRWHLPLAGVWLAVAFWLKYNALAFVVPVCLATVLRPAEPTSDRSRSAADLGAIALGFALVSVGAVAYFGMHGALTDLWRATIDYNVRYSGETYAGLGAMAQYVMTFPFERARVDALWFVGGLGAVFLLLDLRSRREAVVVLAWLAAAVISIAVNGSRGLPQYFVQAAPALALAAAGGLTLAWRRPLVWRAATAIVLLLAAWRVGDEPTGRFVPRVGGLPHAMVNLRFDLQHWLGKIDRRTYLERFGGTGIDGKFSALAVDDLAALVRGSTRPGETVYVFGFASGGVYSKGQRLSASRFFWSRPVVLEFAAPAPGYGSAGLLADLQKTRPALVALQKRDWRIGEPGVPNSIEFFMSNEPLRSWLESGYVPEQDGVVFSVWRRRS